MANIFKPLYISEQNGSSDQVGYIKKEENMKICDRFFNDAYNIQITVMPDSNEVYILNGSDDLYFSIDRSKAGMLVDFLIKMNA